MSRTPTGSKRPAAKDMYWFAHGGIETTSEQGHSRLNVGTDEDDSSEHNSLSLKSIGSMKEASVLHLDVGENSFANEREKEPISANMSQSIGPTRLHPADKRTAVEERKKQLFEAEQERNEVILKKKVEREAALEARRNAHRSNLSFAFGSSIPRNLDLDISAVQHSAETDAQRKRSTRTAGFPKKTEERVNFILESTDVYCLETKFTPLYVTDGSLGRNCSVDRVYSPTFCSQSGYKIHEMRPQLPTNCWLIGSGALIADDVMSRSMISPTTGARGRRKNDLTPTIPYDRTAPPRMVSSTSSRKRSVSMSRLDLLAQPRRHYIEAQKASSTISSSSNAGKDSQPSPSRPLSSASEKSAGSSRVPTSATVTRRPRTAGVKPRPFSIAGTVPDHKSRAEAKFTPPILGHAVNRKAEISNNKKTQDLKSSRPKSLSSDRTVQKSTTKHVVVDKQFITKASNSNRSSPSKTSATSKSTTSKPSTTKQPTAPKQSTPKASPSRKLLTNKKQASILVSAPSETLDSNIEESDKLSLSPIRSPTPDSESQVVEDRNSGKRIISEEEAKTALAEKRKLAREQAEKEAELEKQRLEEIRLQEEEKLRCEEEEQKRMEEEQLRLLAEHRRNEEEKLRRAIEEQERKEEEEKTKRDEETRLKAEQEKRAKEEADKQRIELEEKLRKEEEERAERKKRLEKIMSRTRGKTGTSSPSGSLSGSDQPDSMESQSEQIPSETNFLEDNSIPELLHEPSSDCYQVLGDHSSPSESLEAHATFTLPCEMESLSSNDLMLPSSENTSLDGSIPLIPSENTSLDSNPTSNPIAEQANLESNQGDHVLEESFMDNNRIIDSVVSSSDHAADICLVSESLSVKNLASMISTTNGILEPTAENVLPDALINELPTDIIAMSNSFICESSKSTAAISGLEQAMENSFEVNNRIIGASAEIISIPSGQMLDHLDELSCNAMNQVEQDGVNLSTTRNEKTNTSTLCYAEPFESCTESSFAEDKIHKSVEYSFLEGNHTIDGSKDIAQSGKAIDHIQKQFQSDQKIGDSSCGGGVVGDDKAKNLVTVPSNEQMYYVVDVLSEHDVSNSTGVLEETHTSDISRGHDFYNNILAETNINSTTEIKEAQFLECKQMTNIGELITSNNNIRTNEFLDSPVVTDSQNISLNPKDEKLLPPEMAISPLHDSESIEQDMDITTLDETVPHTFSHCRPPEQKTKGDNSVANDECATNLFCDDPLFSTQTNSFANDQIGFSDKNASIHSQIVSSFENNLLDSKVNDFGSKDLVGQECLKNNTISLDQNDENLNNLLNVHEDVNDIKNEVNSNAADNFGSSLETCDNVSSIVSEGNNKLHKDIDDVNKNEVKLIQVCNVSNTDDSRQGNIEDSAIDVNSSNLSHDFNRNPFRSENQTPLESNFSENISTNHEEITCGWPAPNFEINPENNNFGTVEYDNSKQIDVNDLRNSMITGENPFYNSKINNEQQRDFLRDESILNQTDVPPSNLEESFLGKSHLMATFENANIAESEDSSLDSNLSQVMNVHSEEDAACDESNYFYPQNENVSNGHTQSTDLLKTGNCEQEGFLFCVKPFYNGDSVPKSNGYTASLKEDVTCDNRFESVDIQTDQMSAPSGDVGQYDTQSDNGVNGNNISSVDNGNILDNVDNVNFNKVSQNPFLASESLNQMTANPFLILEDKTAPTELLS